MNLVDAQAGPAQKALLAIAHESPEVTLKEIPHLTMPQHHDVRAENVDLKRLGAVLAVAYERDLRGFADLLLVENLGPRTLQTLAMVAEVIHGTPVRFFGSGPIFICSGRQGPASVSCSAQDL